MVLGAERPVLGERRSHAPGWRDMFKERESEHLHNKADEEKKFRVGESGSKVYLCSLFSF